jgi:hypothetical protein
MLLVAVAVVTGEETRKREREDTRSTQENSRKAPLTRVPARSGSLLLPLFLGQQPGMPAHDLVTCEISPSMLLAVATVLVFSVVEVRKVTHLLIALNLM